jgi:glycosyltransferase involved in cell wall biosynthesis
MNRLVDDALPHVLVVLIRPQGSPARLTGGGEVSTIQIATHLRELGARVAVLERRPSVLSGSAKALDAYTLSNSRGSFRDIIGVIRTVRKTGCDSIYAFTDYFNETILPSFVAALVTRKKLYVNVLSEARRAADSKPFISLIKERVQNRTGFRSLLRYAAYHISRRFACRTGTCLVASRYLATYTRDLLHSRRVFVIGRGVEELWFDRTDVDTTYDGVYSGRFDRSKRVSTLIKAWQIVVARKPDSRLLLIGDSGAELPTVRSLVDELGLSSNVTFAGFVGDRRILTERIRSARLFIFPSVKEGFGLVVAEAMAAGLPCVLSDIAPLREVYGGSAVFARPDEPASFASAILDLLFDEDKRQEYSERSKSLAETFSWNVVARNVLRAMTSPKVIQRDSSVDWA